MKRLIVGGITGALVLIGSTFLIAQTNTQSAQLTGTLTFTPPVLGADSTTTVVQGTSNYPDPECVGTPIEAYIHGLDGEGVVPNPNTNDENTSRPGNTGNFVVPQGKAWVIRAAGTAVVSSGSSPYLEWMIQIMHPVASQGNACCWYVPLYRATGTASSTPTQALNRNIVLTEGEWLSSRVSGLPTNESQLFMVLGWEVPKKCVGRQGGEW